MTFQNGYFWDHFSPPCPHFAHIWVIMTSCQHKKSWILMLFTCRFSCFSEIEEDSFGFEVKWSLSFFFISCRRIIITHYYILVYYSVVFFECVNDLGVVRQGRRRRRLIWEAIDTLWLCRCCDRASNLGSGLTHCGSVANVTGPPI